jgi:hypothetical protein
LWRQTHAPIDQVDEPSPQAETGLEVGRLAHRLFPGGMATKDGTGGLARAIAVARSLIEDRAVPVIFEATLATAPSGN